MSRQVGQLVCAASKRAIQDTLEVINGKWKLLILVTLLVKPLRFKELVREIGITPENAFKGTSGPGNEQAHQPDSLSNKPIAVEYAITEDGKTLSRVLEEMKNWGELHRNKIMKEE